MWADWSVMTDGGGVGAVDMMIEIDVIGIEIRTGSMSESRSTTFSRCVWSLI